MTQTIAAHYDGRVIVPDGPVELPTGRPLRIRVELADEPEPRFAALLGFAADLPGAPPDLAAQHDHYLTGTPER
jgi:hypothetical protein